MRNRFFLIILTTLILGAAGISWIELRFFERRRIELIDHQVEKSATKLIESPQFVASVERLSDLEEMITKILGSDRIGKVFLVTDQFGKPLFQSNNMELLRVALPITPEWSTVEFEGYYIRMMNVPIGDDRVLQVGRVLDHSSLNWSIVNRETVVFISALVISLFASAVVLTVILLSPIRLLGSHLTRAKADLSNLKDVDPLPGQLTKFTKGPWAKADEFSDLVSSVDRLIARINQNYEMTRTWTRQMTHELKTPLAIIRAETEAQWGRNSIPNDYAKSVVSEVDRASETITQFLSWAELEASRSIRDLHVRRLGTVVEQVVGRISLLWKRKFEIEIAENFEIAAGAGHVEQLVSNLLTNACKFSRENSVIRVVVANERLSVADEGSGIPSNVLRRLGLPFNLGANDEEGHQQGSGLGLAWVKTLAKLNGWSLDIHSSENGTKIEIGFPKVD